MSFRRSKNSLVGNVMYNHNTRSNGHSVHYHIISQCNSQLSVFIKTKSPSMGYDSQAINVCVRTYASVLLSARASAAVFNPDATMVESLKFKNVTVLILMRTELTDAVEVKSKLRQLKISYELPHHSCHVLAH